MTEAEIIAGQGEAANDKTYTFVEMIPVRCQPPARTREMTLPEIAQRLHAVMDTYKISRRHDITLLSEIAWVLDMELNVRLTPIEEDEERGE